MVVAAGHELKHKAAMSKARRCSSSYTYINRIENPQDVCRSFSGLQQRTGSERVPCRHKAYRLVTGAQ